MKTLGKLFGVSFVVVLLGALAVGGYFGVKFVVDLFGVLEPQAAVITIIASVIALLCVTIITWGFVRIGQKETKVHMHLEKAQLYERVLLLWGVKLNSKSTAVDQPVEDELQQLAQLLTLHGGPKVIKAYVELHTLGSAVGLHSPDVPSQFAKVLMEMRKDLGLSTLNLQAEDFLPLLVTHVNVVSDPRKAQQRQDLEPRVSLATSA